MKKLWIVLVLIFVLFGLYYIFGFDVVKLISTNYTTEKECETSNGYVRDVEKLQEITSCFICFNYTYSKGFKKVTENSCINIPENLNEEEIDILVDAYLKNKIKRFI